MLQTFHNPITLIFDLGINAYQGPAIVSLLVLDSECMLLCVLL